MTEMIPKHGVKSYESTIGRRADGNFFSIKDQYGEVKDYKYEHKKCWNCHSPTVYTLDECTKVCMTCYTVTNAKRTFPKALKKSISKESNRAKDRRMRSYLYYVINNTG